MSSQTTWEVRLGARRVRRPSILLEVTSAHPARRQTSPRMVKANQPGPAIHPVRLSPPRTCPIPHDEAGRLDDSGIGDREVIGEL